MCDDRTSEFQSLLRSLPSDGGSVLSTSSLVRDTVSPYGGRYGGDKSSASNSKKVSATPNQELRAFHQTAGEISRDIAATSAMLGELTQLVRQKSIFADDSNRINSLVLRIKSSVENLNGRIDEAGATIAQQKRKLGKNSQAGQQASNLVGQLKEEFVEATAGFKKVLQQRTDIMKETSTMKLQAYGQDNTDAAVTGADGGGLVSLENKPPVYTPGGSLSLSGPGGSGGLGAGAAYSQFPTIDLTSGMSTGESSSSASQLPRPHGAAGLDSSIGGGNTSSLRHRGHHGGNVAGMDTMEPIPNMSSAAGYSGNYSSLSSSSPLTPLDIQRMEEESGQEKMMQLIPDQDYLRERENAMTEVETNIVELGTIFNKLAVMVNEHRELVHRVEDNVDEANSNINLSLNALTDTLQNLQTNRALFFKILGVLVVFIILFVVFLA